MTERVATVGLSKRFACTVALDRVSFQIEGPGITGILGPNGAGKTTSAEVLRQALELPAKERAELVVELIASVDGEPDPEAEAAWIAEIEARARRVRAEGSRGSPWFEVRARIENDLRRG